MVAMSLGSKPASSGLKTLLVTQWEALDPINLSSGTASGSGSPGAWKGLRKGCRVAPGSLLHQPMVHAG